jgi:hypothetical protein
MGGEIFVLDQIFRGGKLRLSDKCTQMGSDLATDWPFMDPKWIEPLAKNLAFRPHTDQRWDHFGTHFRRIRIGHFSVYTRVLIYFQKMARLNHVAESPLAPPVAVTFSGRQRQAHAPVAL